MIPTWPADLPQRVLADSFSETLADGRLRTSTETGMGKSRLRFSSAPKPLAVAFKVDPDQKARLERFWIEEIARGALPFLIQDQTKDGLAMLTDDGLQLLDDAGQPLLISAWWLVMIGEGPPVFTTRNRGMTYTAAFPLMVMP
ncbi:hypothetical protein [Methylobacterium goesingense]|uniref:Uncharacterized protein n=1 Tax=Methylobacterium goesingense TaxID=243690 RepID=A0ABV2L3D2_9HYPH|nr:hypothetical protein [Methylobacterium goesingense]GJD73340.1 hypothetical protein CFIICLFH_1567 [Methylobacterium goesingense]